MLLAEATTSKRVQAPQWDSRRNIHLNAIRGFAALVVMYSHLRADFFPHYLDIERRTWLVQALYFLGGSYVARIAVLVFFVLSGYLIGCSVVKQQCEETFTWRRYLFNRLTRLYVVLIPALVFTALIDYAGRTYARTAPLYVSVLPHLDRSVSGDDTLLQFISSLTFLQTIVAGPFGSNGPLWSLAYEFWFYILFPLVSVMVIRRRISVVHSALFLGLAWFVGPWILQLLPGWILGVLTGLVAHRFQIQSRIVQKAFIFGSLAFMAGAAALAGSHVIHKGPVFDYAVIFGFLPLLYVVISLPAPAGRLYQQASDFLSSISYTLYLTHGPFLFFLAASVLGGRPWSVTPTSIILSAAPAAAAVGFAFLMYSLFESHTDRVRNKLNGVIFGSRSNAPVREVQALD
jgi:peptidoglycan/LPS O-acetylase OafA/YrhL